MTIPVVIIFTSSETASDLENPRQLDDASSVKLIGITLLLVSG